MKFRSIKGTKDLPPAETPAWLAAEEAARRIFAAYRYAEIRTPVFEPSELFARSIGELTDIVSKEMYTFTDRGGESVTLRPEGTAAVLRAYIQNNLGEQGSITKLSYIGAMFRQERPQAGRLRQFHQYGAEALGSSSPLLDVEMMLLPMQIASELGVTNQELRLNSVGCETCRPPYRKLLREALNAVSAELSDDSRARLERNPMRVLDSKDPRDKSATAKVPLLIDHLCDECRTHHDTVRSTLRSMNVAFVEDPRLVRGLDYYTKTAFEITSSSLGSQDALAGGGRYDLLVEELGGKPTPGVGFAAGMERLLMAIEKEQKSPPAAPGPDLYLVAADDESRSWAFTTAMELRREGISVEVDYLARSVKAQMRDAGRTGATYVLVAGGNERTAGSGKLKRMSTGEETEVRLDALAERLRRG